MDIALFLNTERVCLHVRHSTLSTVSYYFVKCEEAFKHKSLYFNFFFFPDTNVSLYEKISKDTCLVGRKALWTGKFLLRTQNRLQTLFQNEAAE
jgi:hypothetical protein